MSVPEAFATPFPECLSETVIFLPCASSVSAMSSLSISSRVSVVSLSTSAAEDGVVIFLDMHIHCGGGSGAGGISGPFGSRRRWRRICGFWRTGLPIHRQETSMGRKTTTRCHVAGRRTMSPQNLMSPWRTVSSPTRRLSGDRGIVFRTCEKMKLDQWGISAPGIISADPLASSYPQPSRHCVTSPDSHFSLITEGSHHKPTQILPNNLEPRRLLWTQPLLYPSEQHHPLPSSSPIPFSFCCFSLFPLFWDILFGFVSSLISIRPITLTQLFLVLSSLFLTII